MIIFMSDIHILLLFLLLLYICALTGSKEGASSSDRFILDNHIHEVADLIAGHIKHLPHSAREIR